MIEQGADTLLKSPEPQVGVFAVPETATPIGPMRRFLDALSPLLSNRKAVAGVVILLIFTAVAIFAPVISPGDPNDLVARRHLAPSSEHWFGTTGAGQDVFDQTIWGTRTSLSVGVAVGLFTTIIAALIGMSAGYFGGRIDDVLSLFMNVFLIIPSLPLLVVLVGFLGSGGSWYFIGVLTVTGWSWGARVLRSQTLSIREKDFVSAAEVSGEGRFRIIIGEIFPNMVSLVAANMFGATIFAIGAMSALEFLGPGESELDQLGHQPLLGGKQWRTADRRLVDRRSLRRQHCSGRLLLRAGQLRG